MVRWWHLGLAPQRRHGARWFVASALALAAGVGGARSARAQSCTSMDPSQWPAPSKPYFMVIVDTSGSMDNAVAGGNSCGYESTRIGHARCAVKKTIQAFSGEVSFGLATYSWRLTCPGTQGTCGNCVGTSNTTCFPGCTANYAANDDFFCGPTITEPNINATLNTTDHTGSGYANLTGTKSIHAGGLVAVPLVQDNYWSPPLNASNFQTIFNLVDNNCGNQEIGSDSDTPLGGALFNMNRYFAGTYTDPLNGATLPTPIGPSPQERGCRSINVILITDGDETCDYYNVATYPNREGLAVFEAGRLFNPGVTIGTNTFNIRTHVIGFAGATFSALQNIATAGGGTAQSTANEQQLSQALANIIGGSIKPETCNNADDNCNGCVDEGFVHYCNTGQTCCAWTTTAQRQTCITNYLASITPAQPKGNQALLPCTTVVQSQASATWLCYDPGDVCDNVDNNCNAVTDEGAVKCGSPLHCPQTEVCNGQDDNCNGAVDEGNVCQNTCAVTPSTEVCDGCDNDCDGFTDNGVSVNVGCGYTGPGEPAYCAGTITCKAPVAVPKGTCSPNGGLTTCTYPAPGPQPEACNGLDDDCNGIVDDNVPSTACVPPGTPGGLVYGGTSQCKMGTTQCVNGVTQCVGFVGPSAEICDGLDNNCNGVVDDNVTGVGQQCGKNQPPCTPGTLACVNGALVCSGGKQPTPEVCDGIDNDCNGAVDDGALADAPAPGMNGCWDLPGNCCQFPATNPKIHWCPPPGGGCNDNGSLTAPCNHGALSCVGGAWTCKGPKDPSAEVCDGIDNDCNGTVDDGVMNVGTVCGTNVGECKQGLLQCAGGVLTCVGGVFPTMESCDGKDNDCDGTIDNGIPTGGACTVTYDPIAYPGDRTKGACKPGITQCDGNGGVICVGGVGPQPEVCDGLDNDCDGQIDEVGNPPDGINGTSNPFPPPAGKIGDACGVNQGECKQGAYACLNGQFACVGGQGAKPEECDCQDNDCDGTIDNPNPGNNPPLCSSGKDCIKSSFGCGCATPCDLTNEFPCPGGQICQDVTDSSGNPKGKYCVSDPCGDCKGATATDANNKVLCAPAGTAADPMTCVAPPVCVCKGQNGCKNPCFGVACGTGSVCAEYGANAGTCVPDSCFSVPCQGCGKVCNLGACVANPCDPNPCPSDQECKPKSDFSDHACVPTCAGKTCASGEACDQGACKPTCPAPCGAGMVCDTAQSPPTCVTDKCAGSNPCTNGSYCDPATGSCGNDPCTGVVCPAGQDCKGGSCFTGQGGAGGGSTSSSSSSGATSTSSSSSGSGHGGSGGGSGATGVWGLATGGGGCSCEVGPGLAERFADARWALVALGLVIGARRRRRRGGAGGEEVSR